MCVCVCVCVSRTQVNHNLFTTGGTVTDVRVYVCEQQLQYSTVLSKPQSSTVTPVSKDRTVSVGENTASSL